MKKEGSLEKNLEMMLIHGQKLLTHSAEATQRFVKDLVTQLISANNNGSNYKYEKLMKIYLNQEKLLEELLDFIMIKDEKKCSSIVIHR